MLQRLRQYRQRLHDPLRVAGMLLGYVVTAVVPRAMDVWMIQTLGNLYSRLRPEKENRLAKRMTATLQHAEIGGGTGAVVRAEDARRYYPMAFESSWGRVRGLHRRGWAPKVRVTGLEHLEASRARGQGSILWRMSFCSTPVVKRAMWELGIPLVHLSKEQHGAHSDGWVARHMFCPLYRRSEDWYLGERVVIPWDGNPVGAMRTLLKRLSRDNAVVSIFGDSPWKHGHEVGFFDGRATLAMGAPQLADKVGSTLLPTYAVWEGVGEYRVVIEAPIELDESLDKDDRLKRAVETFAGRMEAAVRAHPESWAYWGLFWGGWAPFVSQESSAPDVS